MSQKMISSDPESNQVQNRPAVQNAAKAGAEDEYFDVLEYLFVLVFHWKTLLLCLLAGALVFSIYHANMVGPQYKASTELYVTSSDSVISLQDLQLGSALTADYQSIITSRGVLNQVIDDLDLNVDFRTLKKMVSVTNASGTHIIHTDVTTDSLTLSRDIANDLLKVSIDRIYQIVGTSEPSVIDYSQAEAVEDVTPSQTRYMLYGGVLGVVLAAGFFLIRMLMNSTLKSEEDVKKFLQLPVLAAVPYYED